MRLSPARFGALAVCLALSCPAMAKDEAKAIALAGKFEHALQQQRYADAAAMFGPQDKEDLSATADQLKRFDERIGGFSTMRNVLSMPAGSSVRLAIPAAQASTVKPKKSYQIAYTATAADGKPVSYVLDVDGERTPLRVLSFAVHLPTLDAQAAARAQHMLDGVHH